jgi:formylglycine-generating enzyme required for sulfatase activity
MPPLPRAAELPDDIRDLVLYQKQDVAHERFGRDLADLARAIVLARKAARAPGGTSGHTRWLTLAAGLAALVVGGGLLVHQMIVPPPWSPASSGVRPAGSNLNPVGHTAGPTGANQKADEDTERQQLAMLKAEEDKKRAADEAKRKADADAKAKADTEAKRKADADSESKRKAEEAELHRLAMLQEEEKRKRVAEVTSLSQMQEHALKPKDTFKECDVCPEMVVVPAGEFMMGSNDGNPDEKPVHKVTIRAPFAVGKFEVTFVEWEACVAGGGCTNSGDEGWGKGRRPVINVSWYDVKDYVLWLSRRTGKNYRLLSEAEWEYAARAGSTTRYHFGNDENDLCSFANVADLTLREGARATTANCRDGYAKTAPVGSFKANAFGLHDMHGNASEWVEDCHSLNYDGAPADGSARTRANCISRISRGGSWSTRPIGLRSTLRSTTYSELRSYNGFRVARTLSP